MNVSSSVLYKLKNYLTFSIKVITIDSSRLVECLFLQLLYRVLSKPYL